MAIVLLIIGFVIWLFANRYHANMNDSQMYSVLKTIAIFLIFVAFAFAGIAYLQRKEKSKESLKNTSTQLDRDSITTATLPAAIANSTIPDDLEPAITASAPELPTPQKSAAEVRPEGQRPRRIEQALGTQESLSVRAGRPVLRFSGQPNVQLVYQFADLTDNKTKQPIDLTTYQISFGLKVNPTNQNSLPDYKGVVRRNVKFLSEQKWTVTIPKELYESNAVLEPVIYFKRNNKTFQSYCDCGDSTHVLLSAEPTSQLVGVKR